MSFKLEDVKGLGKKTDVLVEAGIDSVEKLAASSVDDLIDLKGIGKASAEKFIGNAKSLLGSSSKEGSDEESTQLDTSADQVDDKKAIEEEMAKLQEKRKKLEGKKVENGDFVLVKITGKTQKGTIFRVSSEDDARKSGIYDEEKAKQGYYTPEFVIAGKPGFLNEGLTETVEKLNFFEKKSVRIPPTKAFGKRDPQKIERIGINKFRKLNDGKNPEYGQDFVKKGTGQRGTVTRVNQGKVIVDYNHPLAGQSIDYNIEVIDIIEDFNDKIEYFMISNGIPKENVSEFTLSYDSKSKDLEIIIPKMFLFQNLTYIKFGLAMDLQSHMADDINNVKFIEVYEKMPVPTLPAATTESIEQKVGEFEKEQDDSEKKQ
ncbi:MAG: helix-hairpin-helix domain-containing protein [Promethearchaeota archaeon]